MPGYRDHMLFGAVLALFFAYLAGPVLSYGPEVVFASSVLVLLASVFPDIDHAGSVIHRRVRAFTVVSAAVLPLPFLYPDPLLMLSGSAAAGSITYYLFLRLKPRHRTVTHTANFGAFFSLTAGTATFIGFGTFLPGAFALVAYISHLLLDGIL